MYEFTALLTRLLRGWLAWSASLPAAGTMSSMPHMNDNDENSYVLWDKWTIFDYLDEDDWHVGQNVYGLYD